MDGQSEIGSDAQAKRIYDVSFALEEAGKFDEAFRQRLRLVEYDGENPFFIAILGKSYEALNRLEEAEQCFRRAISLRPGVESFSLLLFNFLWDRGRKDEGFDEMRRFVPYGGSPIYTELLKKINNQQ